ncbi:GNAT family N-acetyltransferase [Streptomyces sp. NPDC058000]|uniref:GNAT family N-acetyltransferase n=1 Tax=Streptomyces sp. NPDC058000 TaxID=3346299 RepID=UPI0036E17865
MELRELTEEDAPALQKIYRGASLTYIERQGLSAAEAITMVSDALTGPHGRWVFGIAVDDDLVGKVRLRCRAESHAAISYVLREDSWGHGYATQAVAGMLRYAFTATGMTSIGARHHPDNTASGRVLQKNGFTYRGTFGGWLLYDLRKTNGWHPRSRTPLPTTTAPGRPPPGSPTPPVARRR